MDRCARRVGPDRPDVVGLVDRSPVRCLTEHQFARFDWTLPPDTGLWSAPVVSPDGRRIVWAGVSDAGSAQLYVRDLSADESHALSGTTSARQPFWSADGRWIGCFARGKLRKIAATGGPVTDLADAPDARGGTWSPARIIVFQPNYRDSPLMRVSDRGGRAEPVTTLDIKQDDVSQRWPSFLPDGRHFLYFGVSVNDRRRGVYVGSLDEPTAQPTRPLFLSDSGAIYAPGASRSAGFVLSANNGRIEVRPFDADRLILTGEARALEMNATPATPHHPALMSASATVLASRSPSAQTRTLVSPSAARRSSTSLLSVNATTTRSMTSRSTAGSSTSSTRPI
jgi:hypothetical protein